MSTKTLKVPNIGDFEDVVVIEVLVEPGDTIEPEQGLVTVESDKASMEIPAEVGGVVKELKVALGDHVAEGDVLVEIEVAEAQAEQVEDAKPEAAKPEAAQPSAEAAPARQAAEDSAVSTGASTAASAAPSANNGRYDYDVVVIGAGPGGYSAAFRAADLGLNVALIERYPTLGGVCLNVGCIPSKALLHTVAQTESAMALSVQGISFAKPEIDLDTVRSFKDGVVGKLTKGLAGMARARKVTVIQGLAKFAGAHQLSVTDDDGAEQSLSFAAAIIAAGSQAIKLPFLPDDPRIVDSTGALTLPFIPEKMLLIGGGIIGLEMGTVYSGLGSRLDIVEMQDRLMLGPDADIVRIWQKFNEHRFDNVYLNTKTVSAEARDDGIWVQFEGKNAPSEPQRYDLVLQAVGRSPNGLHLAAEKAGVDVAENGFISVDSQMRTNVPHIYAIGDIIGQPMLAHKAVHEGHVAAEAIAGQKSHFDARVIPSVAYTDPEVAWAGLTETEAREQGLAVKKGVFPWAASGRAIANARDEGMVKLLFDEETGRIVGGSIVGTGAGDLISEVALAIEMGADSIDIAKTIHPHPTLGETVGMAAAAADGACTDLPPQRR